jgi:UDP-glucose 4-epimerase
MSAPLIQVEPPAVIVTGAGGFIGGYAAAALAKRGWRVGLAGNEGGGASLAAAFRWGEISAEALAELAVELGGISAVVHCAGGASVGPSLLAPDADFLRTVASTMQVADFVRRNAPGARIVFLSSAAVYGASACEPLSEDQPRRPISPYGAHKAMAEDLLMHWAECFGLEVSILRLFSVYGAGLRKQLLWEISRRALKGETPLTLFGSGTERRDFLAVEDAAELIALATDPSRRPPLVLNGGSGRATTVQALAESLLLALGVDATPRFNGQSRSGDPLTLVADTRRAEAFGFSANVVLSDGLAQYAAWVRKA